MGRQFSLSDKERQVLVAVTLNADTSMKSLAREVGLREHSVRYICKSLLDRQIIRPIRM